MKVNIFLVMTLISITSLMDCSQHTRDRHSYKKQQICGLNSSDKSNVFMHGGTRLRNVRRQEREKRILESSDVDVIRYYLLVKKPGYKVESNVYDIEHRRILELMAAARRYRGIIFVG